MTLELTTGDRPSLNGAFSVMRVEVDALLAAGGPQASIRSGLLLILRRYLKEQRAEAEARLKQAGKGLECATSLSLLQDRMIGLLYDVAIRHFYQARNPSTSERLAIVAVGGFGRGTLAPGSDIDLLFLLPYKQTAWGESIAEFILYVLWDLRLKVGHATRSIDDCIRLASSDDTILTALLEKRFSVAMPGCSTKWRRACARK